MNFHSIVKKENILKVIKYRIPNRVGHSFGKWSGFFNYPVPFNINIGNQVDNNLELLNPLKIQINNIDRKVFLKTEQVDIPFAKYICIAPFLYTDPRKRLNSYYHIIEKAIILF
jgi:hypothetical protein